MIALVVLGALLGMTTYAFVAMLVSGALGRRWTYAMEPTAVVVGALWPVGLPIVLGAWLARRTMRRRA